LGIFPQTWGVRGAIIIPKISSETARKPIKRHKVNSLGSASLGYYPRQSLSTGIPRQSLGTRTKGKF